MPVTRAVFVWCGLAALGTPAYAESTRTLEASLPVSPGTAFAVENLAGTLTVGPASDAALRVKVTVHAESEELAASLGVATVTGKDGIPTLRVAYPVDRHDQFRYPPRGAGRDSNIEYAGHRVGVSGSRGVLLYADLVVEVPVGAGKGRLETHAGAIGAERLDGNLRLETGSGEIRVSHSKGDLVAATGSGNVTARDVHGSFRCDTGGGICQVEDFEGDQLTCDTGSGAVLVTRARARMLNLDTGSGRVRLDGIEAEEVKVDTGSGPVELAVIGDRLRKFAADTGSGMVRVRLPPEAEFEARAVLGSGDVRCDYSDAKRIVKRNEIVGCRRGDGHIEIKVESGSGGLVIEPAR